MALLNKFQRRQMEHYLASAGNSNKVMTLPMACGFIHGVVITPVVGSPLDWIPEIFGGEFPDLEEENILELVTFFSTYLNAQLEAFYDNRLIFPFDYSDLDQQMADEVYEWVLGLHLALTDHLDLWMQEEDPFVRNEEIDNVSQALFYIHSLADPESLKSTLSEEHDFDPLDSETVARLLTAMPASVEVLTRYGLKLNQKRQAATAAVSSGQAGKKVGRNAPCPCGSGKKYKKCCARSGS